MDLSGTLPETRICALPDDLLVKILLLVPTKDALATPILSKRWRYVWTMLPKLAFKDENSKSIGWLTEKSMQLHKAPKLESLCVEFGPECVVDAVDVVKLVDETVKMCVEKLDFTLRWDAEPTTFPKSLYTCNTLVNLTLSQEIVVDVPSSALLPSLLYLNLTDVVYKVEDSLVRLLSSCPVLNELDVYRRRWKNDNLTNIIIKVPSLQKLKYLIGDDDYVGSLVIDSPALTILDVGCSAKEYLLIENMPRLDVSRITCCDNTDDKFLKSFLSTIHLHLYFTKSMVACRNGIKFSRLIELCFCPDICLDWVEPLMFFLHNSPKLTILTIDMENGAVPNSWNQPSTTPGCLSSHLKIFRWQHYRGNEDEKQLMTYILANAKRLKTVETSINLTCNPEERRTEIESIPRISTSAQLLFPTQMEYRFCDHVGFDYMFN